MFLYIDVFCGYNFSWSSHCGHYYRGGHHCYHRTSEPPVFNEPAVVSYRHRFSQDPSVEIRISGDNLHHHLFDVSFGPNFFNKLLFKWSSDPAPHLTHTNPPITISRNILLSPYHCNSISQDPLLTLPYPHIPSAPPHPPLLAPHLAHVAWSGWGMMPSCKASKRGGTTGFDDRGHGRNIRCKRKLRETTGLL